MELCAPSVVKLTIKLRYMKSFTVKQFLPFAAALLLAACTSTDEVDGTGGGGDGVIGFRQPAVSRAAVDDASQVDDFSVWGYRIPSGDGEASVLFDGAKVYRSGNGWTYDDAPKYWAAGYVHRFVGLYPDGQQANTKVASDGTLTLTGFTATGDVDLMTAAVTYEYTDVSETPPAVQMPFGHELSRVQLVVKTDQGVTATITRAVLYGMSNTGTLTRPLSETASSSWNLDTATTSDNTPFKNEMPVTLDPASTATLWDGLLLIPQSTSGLKLHITLQRSGEQPSTETVTLDNPARWTAAQSYRYVLTIEADAITFGGFTVPDWGETNTGGNINIGK